MLMFLTGAAQPAQGAQVPTASAQLVSMLVMLVPFFLLMWLLIIRPQKKQQEAHRRMIAALKKGDRVVTAGGLVGEITDIDEDEVRVRIADKVEARFVKSSVTRVIKG
ncbi:MAG: preprotein translocase subunit YajC [Bacteroidota bacterium]